MSRKSIKEILCENCKMNCKLLANNALVFGCFSNHNTNEGLQKAFESYESQYKAEVEELKKTVSSQAEIIYKLENECSFDYKCPVNSNLQKQNEELKKKLKEAVKLIRFINSIDCPSGINKKTDEFLKVVKGE